MLGLLPEVLLTKLNVNGESQDVQCRCSDGDWSWREGLKSQFLRLLMVISAVTPSTVQPGEEGGFLSNIMLLLIATPEAQE